MVMAVPTRILSKVKNPGSWNVALTISVAQADFFCEQRAITNYSGSIIHDNLLEEACYNEMRTAQDTVLPQSFIDLLDVCCGEC